MRKIGQWLVANVDARDLVMIAGLALLAIGLFQVSVPAAFIVPGAVLTFVALRGGPKLPQSGADD